VWRARTIVSSEGPGKVLIRVGVEEREKGGGEGGNSSIKSIRAHNDSPIRTAGSPGNEEFQGDLVGDNYGGKGKTESTLNEGYREIETRPYFSPKKGTKGVWDKGEGGLIFVTTGTRFRE